ncbi:saccharopine dehydrogenase [Capsaspora owczarzaki ATCC 30864]|uniref:Saccharopine dehydrogenase, variant n=1 Tax=Capsaspora owczarzaki (strain ATCC 30864) TaxID=595528 RepID=A0A0D2X0Q6_CAPO3|nr:saccharopine dehydrogenase [Capsaspora owczarzaki ATCC 30864]KJE89474.1 saccharopine dehydrogenase, variant [Capsaspora owczarzaki ATCC 30864]|eukprot:XP_004365806.2 saccharopine dehydrogenase [Capsaspora owczarzaki ATCC 30864]
MSSLTREFDAIVFGATGFTGAMVVEDIARSNKDKLSWAVAGRNKAKLQEVLNNVASTLNDQSIKNIPLVIADVADEASLKAMAQRARVILDCVGPYRFYGEQVVKACIDAGTDFLDVSGEPQYLETIALKYHKQAEEKGVIVVNTCGFDSIPADLGTAFAVQQFGTPELVSNIESYLSIHSGPEGMGGHYATYESAVHGFGARGELDQLRRQAGASARLPIVAPPIKRRAGAFFHKESDRWCMPFMGADASVVRRTQRVNYEARGVSPIQYGAYFTISSFWTLILFFFFGSIFQLFARYPFGRKILLKHPKLFTFGLFSHEGPTRRQLNTTSFSMTFYALGYSSKDAVETKRPDKKIVTRVAGPEPGYIATPIFLVQSALVLLQERKTIPYKGGVLTPAAAFAQTSLIERLQQHGVNFSVIKVEALKK